MGCVANITADAFPRQMERTGISGLGARVRFFFHFDTTRSVLGRIVRADAEEPGKIIIALDDGRYVLSTECQWQVVPGGV